MPSDLSARDKDLIVRTILGEAASEGPRGQAAVAHVILNRTARGDYGKNASEVVLAPHQFEPWQTKAQQLMAIRPDSQAYRETSDLLDLVTSGEIPDPTSGATHFLNPKIVMARRGSLPDWAQKPVATIGNHQFFAPEGRVVNTDPMDAINKGIAMSGDQ